MKYYVDSTVSKNHGHPNAFDAVMRPWWKNAWDKETVMWNIEINQAIIEKGNLVG